VGFITITLCFISIVQAVNCMMLIKQYVYCLPLITKSCCLPKNMLKKILKITGIGLGLILVAVLAFYAFAHFKVESRLDASYQVNVRDIDISSDSATLAHGEYIVRTRGCRDCHGEDMSGKVFLDDPGLGRIVATNLTKGKGGLPKDYSKTDYLWALRHGIRRDGKPLWLMPSAEYASLSDKDMSAMIAYLQTLPAKDSELPKQKLGVMGRVLTYFGQLPLLDAEHIEHTKVQPTDVAVEPTVAYGEYLSASCTGCHRTNFKGGPPLAPGFPVVPDITSTGRVGAMNQEQFLHFLRTGQTVEGRQVNPENMPWTMTKEYNEEELIALYKYLSSI
jgi:mono/diheme cytochrome c family protein